MNTDERMFAKFTLDFADSPKIAPLSDKAFRHFVEAVLWSRRLMTDGFIPTRMAMKLFDEESLEELMENDSVNPSIIKVVDGYQIHDYSKHQITNDWVEKKREAGRKGGLAKQKSSKPLAPASVSLKQTSSTLSSENLPEKEKEKEIYLISNNNAPEIRSDVSSLCSLLAESIVANGARRPSITKAWLDEARLLLDKDGQPFDEVVAVMRWCQNDSFWRSNILSMPTFRKQYDRLKLASKIGLPQTNAQKNLSIVAQFEAQERKELQS